MYGLKPLGEPDLLIGLLLMLSASCVLLFAGLQIGRPLKKRGLTLCFIGTLLVLTVWWLLLKDRPLLASVLPFSNLILIGNWTCLFLGFLAGLAFYSGEGTKTRRAISPALLMTLGLFSLIQPLLGTEPETSDRPVTEICRQTSPYSCSAACAATVLHQAGIETNEKEMVSLCLSRKGTTWQGLYRGLKLKTAEHSRTVEVSQIPFEQLPEQTPGWLILSVGLPRWGDFDPIYEEEYGWRRGELHSVILRDFLENDRVQIVDPDVGQEEWSVADLRLLYRGFYFRLGE